MNNRFDQRLTGENSPDLGLWIVSGLIAGTLIGVITSAQIFWMGVGISLGIVIGAIKSMKRE